MSTSTTSTRNLAAVVAVALLASVGCTYEEPIDRVELDGIVRIPKDMVTYTWYDENDEPVEVTDPSRHPFEVAAENLWHLGLEGPQRRLGPLDGRPQGHTHLDEDGVAIVLRKEHHRHRGCRVVH